MVRENFTSRHIGPNEQDQQDMLAKIGYKSLDDLINDTVPPSIRLKGKLNLPKGQSEYEYLNDLKKLSAKNKLYKSFIGMGYYGTITPPVIQRNVLENPGWYTAYTPYQAEISQGRLEALLNFQTMVMDLTAMEIANASLLDEATAAAEAMSMLFASRSREQSKNNVNRFFVDENVLPQTKDVLITRSQPLDIELVIGNWENFNPEENYFGALIQYPNQYGEIEDYKNWVNNCHDNEVRVVVASDLLALTLITPPGEWGADVVVGSAQRFGVPMGFGGPHAAFFATREHYKRQLPGRIIGVSQDREGNRTLRMALQTREQHIKRDKATSNICTAQALLATMASMYAVYHGAQGLTKIAEFIRAKAQTVHSRLQELGYRVGHKAYFDTIFVEMDPQKQLELRDYCNSAEINLRYEEDRVCISIDEATTPTDVNNLVSSFASLVQEEHKTLQNEHFNILEDLPVFAKRTSPFLSHPVFNKYHSETEMMRYLKRLENKDISLTHSMIPLGSCTMKLNAASELMPITWPEFASIHPFTPSEQVEGYLELLKTLEQWLAEVTGFHAVSLQPNSGAQGEYAGLMVIRAYHISRGDKHRNVVLIPSSAHGTNPASAVMAGMRVVVVKCDEDGNIDTQDLKEKAEKHRDELSCLMVTYPSTHGVFEENILEITEIIHQNGGQVYMDGANMNAQVGLTNPGKIGADVCHLNLHKTFAIPHGGGGPGMGPIGVAEHLTPFLPGHSVIHGNSENHIPAVSAAPFGSALILIISYGYMKMLGRDGLEESTKNAILNANYLKALLEEHYPVLYKGKKGTVAHEMILDLRSFKEKAGIEAEDVAKRLIDFGFHAPTLSFPVAGTVMIEPTESESKEELDRFADSMICIRQEIEEVVLGIQDRNDNVLKNAPHTMADICSDDWKHGYSREKAAFALPHLKQNKYWAPTRRVDNAFGDRNL
ncbi:MAG: aminomethyl-transferring glycine dehydrogenase, partial [Luteibaculum sp.]